MKAVTLLVFLLYLVSIADAQTVCTALGQNPSTAFPVCGTGIFSQSTVPYCGGKPIATPCQNNSTIPYSDINPFWYKFTCYSSGTLAFLLTPIDLNDDYDWQLFDVTGHDLNEVYTNAALIVGSNWSGNTGITGANGTGTSLQNCGGTGYPTISAMPQLQKGHQYLLLVSHFTTFRPSEKGYQLSFGGGTASITDTLKPALQSAEGSCDATKIFIHTNKKMKCSSLALDGSDFTIVPAVAGVVSAQAVCDAFDMDSMELELDKPLPPGNYTIRIQNGSDGNTLLDNCGTSVPSGSTLPLTILPFAPTPMDSLVPPQCAPASLQLVFKKNIRCSSVATDGSDFTVTGPSPVTVTGASASCASGGSKVISVTLSAPVVTAGTYRLVLRTGDDGNTLLDECGRETPAGSTIDFSVKDTVSADFSYFVQKGCRFDTVHFSNPGNNGITSWHWQFDGSGTSTLQNPVNYFDSFGIRKVTLEVSNGFCSDTTSNDIILDNNLKAAFETTNTLCPEDSATFKNESTGNIISWYWNFQNGNTSESKDPEPQKYPVLLAEHNYTVMLVVKNDLGCFDTALNPVRVLKSCYIAVPTAFTPNGDGLNDYLYPLNAYKADRLDFRVYNRYGQLVFETRDWTHKWDGTLRGAPQDAGIYVWTLSYQVPDTGRHVFMKGSSVLIR